MLPVCCASSCVAASSVGFAGFAFLTRTGRAVADNELGFAYSSALALTNCLSLYTGIGHTAKAFCFLASFNLTASQVRQSLCKPILVLITHLCSKQTALISASLKKSDYSVTYEKLSSSVMSSIIASIDRASSLITHRLIH